MPDSRNQQRDASNAAAENTVHLVLVLLLRRTPVATTPHVLPTKRAPSGVKDVSETRP